MSYPLINGAVINGSSEDGGGSPPGTLAAYFSPPRLVLKLSSSGLPAVTFGQHRLQIGVDTVVPVSGLQAARHGFPRLVLGMPPSGSVFQAAGLMAVGTGVPTLQSSMTAGPVPGLQPTTAGAPRLELRMPVIGGVAPARFGVAGSAERFAVSGLSCARVGALRTVQSMPVARGVGPAGVGTPRLKLGGMSFHAEGALAARHGAPYFGGQAFRARGVLAARAGRPELGRSSAC